MDPLKKKWLGIALRAAFTLACLGYLFATIPILDRVDLKGGGKLEGEILGEPSAAGVRFIPREGGERLVPASDLEGGAQKAVHLGLRSAVKGLKWDLMSVALGIVAVNQLFLVFRWKSLLDAQDIRLGYGELMRLNLTGLFFNNTMPGQTGGDVVKAYAVAKRAPGKGTAAVVTVFLDRVVGMTGLVTLAGGVSAFMAWKDPRFVQPACVINAILGGLLAGGAFYLSPLKARLLPSERVRALPLAGPLLGEIDQAVALYRDHKGALVRSWLLALLNHSGYILMGVAIGRALGITAEEAGLAPFVVIIALVSMIGCIPVSIMGFGLGEVAYVKAFGSLLGVAAAKALALSLLTRFTLIAMGLAGGIVVLLGRRRPQ